MDQEDAVAAKTADQEEHAWEGGLTGITFDAGGLIALEHNDRRVLSIIRTALDGDGRFVIPATALAQVIRNPAKQVRLWRMLQHDRTDVVPLDASHAQAVGLLLATSRTSDIADAHVVICAQRAGHAVITSDPFDLRRLDPTLRVIATQRHRRAKLRTESRIKPRRTAVLSAALPAACRRCCLSGSIL